MRSLCQRGLHLFGYSFLFLRVGGDTFLAILFLFLIVLSVPTQAQHLSNVKHRSTLKTACPSETVCLLTLCSSHKLTADLSPAWPGPTQAHHLSNFKNGQTN